MVSALEFSPLVPRIGDIAFSDLAFRRVPLAARSSRGTPYTRMVPIGMPRIPPQVLDCVCYLYPTEEAARKGEDFGGTGFFVQVPSRIPGRSFPMVITNHHVACTGGHSVVRINTIDGGTDIFPFEPHEWHFDPAYDLAVMHISVRQDLHKIAMVSTNYFFTRDVVERRRIGPGDDVFMPGRFVDHDGGPINRPAVRFGNISVMPSRIKQPNGVMAEAYCIDLHSRPGYSGSPVFVFRTPGTDLEEKAPTDSTEAKILFDGTHFMGLLGVHFAQFPEQWEIQGHAGAPSSQASSVPLIKGGAYIKGLSGMACVLPAWNVLDLINSPPLVEYRRRHEEALEETLRRQGQEAPSPEGEKSG